MKYRLPTLLHKPAWRLGALLIADALVFGSTSAGSVVAFMLIIGFLLLLATTYQFIQLILLLVNVSGLSPKRTNRLAIGLTGLAGMLVALQSIGELSRRDMLVLLPLVILGYLYSSYNQDRRSPSA